MRLNQLNPHCISYPFCCRDKMTQWKTTYRRKSLLWLMFHREATERQGWGGQGSSQSEPEAERANFQPHIESKLQLGWGFRPPKPIPVLCFLQQGYTSEWCNNLARTASPTGRYQVLVHGKHFSFKPLHLSPQIFIITFSWKHSNFLLQALKK